MDRTLNFLDVQFGRLLVRAANAPLLAVALIFAIALPLFLSGFVELPPVDRTEVRYAQTSKQMLEAGNFLVPRFQTEPQFTQPIGIFWLQALSARLAGSDALHAMWAYRLPSLIGVVLALLITFFAARRLFGAEAALFGVVLLAINPIIVLQAHLALSKGIHLAFVAAAQWSLACLYVNTKGERIGRWAFVFWLAQGFGVLTGTLSLFLLSLATIAGLAAFDRDVAWLRRLRAHWGLPLAALVVAPWLVALALNPEPEVVRNFWLNALFENLAGPQKFSRFGFPGMYALGLCLSFLSAAVLLAPAAKDAWAARKNRPQRFLLMWVLGYLALAEPFLNKPPLYTVQMLLPAIAVSFGILLSSIRESDPRLHFHPSVWFGTLIQGLSPALALTAFVLWQNDPLKWVAIILCLIVALCVVSAHLSIRNAQPFASIGLLVIAAILLNATALQIVLPNYRNIWSSGRLAEISRTIAPCIPDRVLVGGYVEPSAVFEIGTSAYITKGRLAGQSAANWLDEKKGRIAFVAEGSLPGFHSQAKQVGLAAPLRVACIGGFNVGSIKWTNLELFVMASERELAACPVPAHARCLPEKK